ILRICKRVARSGPLSKVGAEGMARGLAELFAAREKHFADFVFGLTQNFFYLRLLGLADGLAMLAEDKFRGTQFILDTNVVIALLLRESRHHRSMLEMKSVCSTMQASLHVTEVTLAELDRVILHHRTHLVKAYNEVPDAMVVSTQGVFLKAYRARRDAGQDITPSQFLDTLSNARATLTEEHRIAVLDSPVESGLPAAELRSAWKILAQASSKVRHKAKPQAALDHDAHLYFLVRQEREQYGEGAAWILTLDSSLPAAARQMQGDES
ncbi:unnamed protein product, partial [marine sediment metagenome]